MISGCDGLPFGFRHDAGDVGKLKWQEEVDDVGPLYRLKYDLIVQLREAESLFLDKALEEREMERLEVKVMLWVL